MEQPPNEQPGSPTPSPSECNWAMASHLGTAIVVLFGGWFINILVPLFLLLWKRRDSPFVVEHAREELNFQISLSIYVVGAVVLTVLTLGLGLVLLIPAALIFGVVIIVVIIRASLAASRGEPYRYPLTMRLVR